MTKQKINNQTNVKKQAGFPPSYAFKADLEIDKKSFFFERPMFHIKVYVTYLNDLDIPTTKDIGDAQTKSEFVEEVYNWIESNTI